MTRHLPGSRLFEFQKGPEVCSFHPASVHSCRRVVARVILFELSHFVDFIPTMNHLLPLSPTILKSNQLNNIFFCDVID